MATCMNRVYLLGRLTRDPEAKRVGAGSTVGELALAVSESYRNKEGKQVEKTCFVDIVVWNKQAEVCETYLQKGSAILVEGRLQLDEWQDQEGQKRTRLRVRADRVHFMDPPRKGERSKQDAPASAAA